MCPWSAGHHGGGAFGGLHRKPMASQKRLGLFPHDTELQGADLPSVYDDVDAFVRARILRVRSDPKNIVLGEK